MKLHSKEKCTSKELLWIFKALLQYETKMTNKKACRM